MKLILLVKFYSLCYYSLRSIWCCFIYGFITWGGSSNYGFYIGVGFKFGVYSYSFIDIRVDSCWLNLPAIVLFSFISVIDYRSWLNSVEIIWSSFNGSFYPRADSSLISRFESFVLSTFLLIIIRVEAVWFWTGYGGSGIDSNAGVKSSFKLDFLGRAESILPIYGVSFDLKVSIKIWLSFETNLFFGVAWGCVSTDMLVWTFVSYLRLMVCTSSETRLRVFDSFAFKYWVCLSSVKTWVECCFAFVISNGVKECKVFRLPSIVCFSELLIKIEALPIFGRERPVKTSINLLKFGSSWLFLINFYISAEFSIPLVWLPSINL